MSSTSTHQAVQAFAKVQFRQMTEVVLDASVVEAVKTGHTKLGHDEQRRRKHISNCNKALKLWQLSWS
eukprot:5484039-Prorocentrum_lima.AAC.1